MIKVILCWCALLLRFTLATVLDAETVEIAGLICQLDDSFSSQDINEFHAFTDVIKMEPMEISNAYDVPLTETKSFSLEVPIKNESTVKLSDPFDDEHIPFTGVLHNFAARNNALQKQPLPKGVFHEFRLRPETPKLKPGMSKRAESVARTRFSLRSKLKEWLKTLEAHGYEKVTDRHFGYFIARKTAFALRSSAIEILGSEYSSQLLSEDQKSMLERLSEPLPDYFDPENTFQERTPKWANRVEKRTRHMIEYLYDIAAIVFQSGIKKHDEKAAVVKEMAEFLLSFIEFIQN